MLDGSSGVAEIRLNHSVRPVMSLKLCLILISASTKTEGATLMTYNFSFHHVEMLKEFFCKS